MNFAGFAQVRGKTENIGKFRPIAPRAVSAFGLLFDRTGAGLDSSGSFQADRAFYLPVSELNNLLSLTVNNYQ